MRKLLTILSLFISIAALAQTTPTTPPPGSPQLMSTNTVYQDAVTKKYYVYNGSTFLWRQLTDSLQVKRMIAASGGTVTSITPGIGFLSHTPITTSGTMNVDTGSVIQTIPNLYPRGDLRWLRKADSAHYIPTWQFYHGNNTIGGSWEFKNTTTFKNPGNSGLNAAFTWDNLGPGLGHYNYLVFNGKVAIKEGISQITIDSNRISLQNIGNNNNSMNFIDSLLSVHAAQVDNVPTNPHDVVRLADLSSYQTKIVFSVIDYGADPTGATNSRTAVQNTINAASLVKGTVTFPAGKFDVTGGLHIDSAIMLMGLTGNYSVNPADSAFNSGGSRLTTTSATDTLIKTTQTGIVFNGIALINLNASPSAGYGIFMAKAGSFSMYRTVVKGFYTNVEIQQGVSWTIDDSRFINPVSRNMHILSNTTPDQGDWSISNSSFLTKNNATDLYIESSGGMKISNCKFQPLLGNHSRFFAGIDVNAATPGTSDLQVSNCSIEGFNGYAIRVRKQGGATFGNVMVTGNQITAFATITGNGIFMDGIYGVSITGNSINDGDSNVNAGILLNNCTGGVAYPNAMAGWSTPISMTGTSAGNSPASVQYQPIFNGKASTASLTNGSVLFVNGANLASESPTTFNWDGSRLGIGRLPVTEKLEVQGSLMIGNTATPQIGSIHGDYINKGTGGALQISVDPSTAANQKISLGRAVTSTGTFTPYLTVLASGVVQFNNYGLGLAHIDASGNTTSSLLVNADITAGTIDLTTKVTGVLPAANGGTNLNATQTTVSGSTSGNAKFSQPEAGTSSKKVIVYMAALVGTASYTFPTAFTNTPVIVTTNGPAAGIVTALSTTAITVTGATTTGFIILQGY